ncbi:MAG: DUF4349 domain-containing protein, partial [Chloroflexi bacterium]|nr:DUF4349 domain-containing protein [Chloroflexota bacterium]
APAKPAGAPAAPAPAQSAPAPSGSGQSAEGSNPALVRAPADDRRIIYTTEISLLVKSVTEAVATLTNLATGSGGFVAGVESKEEQNLPVTVVKLRVPPARYDATIAELRRMAVEVKSEKATTQDITEEFADVQTQIASLEATHKQLLEILTQAKTVEDIIRINERANSVKLQIDRLKGRLSFLERQSDLATITAFLRPAEGWLARDYSAQRSSLRKAEANKAAAELALQRAKTPEEANAARDRLSESTLEVERLSARLKEIEAAAKRAEVELPQAPPEAASLVNPAQQLPEEYIKARVELRKAERSQDRITKELRRTDLSPEQQTELRNQLRASILEVQRLQAQVRNLTERAQQLAITLPALTPEQEAALIGDPAEPAPAPPSVWRPVRLAWEQSLTFLSTLGVGLLVLVAFFWWLILPLAIAIPFVYRFVANRRRPRVGQPPVSPPPASQPAATA